MAKVMIAGYGSAGQYVVDFLLKDHRISPSVLEGIYIMSRKSVEEVTPRLEISNVAAGICERYIPIKYMKCDFNDIEGMAKRICNVQPDVIVYTGRYAAGLKYGSFSYPNQIGYGAWIPMSFPYIYNLMKAVRLSGVKTKVINTSFPDGVNHLLGTVGLAPYCGAGNLNHLVPRIKRAAARIYNTDPQSISVDLSCAHYVNTYVSKEGTGKGCASLLRLFHLPSRDDLLRDESVNVQNHLKEQVLYPQCKDTSAGGQIRNQMIASDCAEIVRYLIDPGSSGVIHVPGIEGLPGGCKCVATKGELKINSVWSRSEIEQVGKIGLMYDGIEIKPDEVHFTESTRQKMKDVFNIDYPELLHVDEMQEFADTLKDKLYSISGKV